ncbi:MAG: alcohol dehydrogenase [Deltaproteobacteria bacterium]|nr:alcohol dehydrogenase [Deltaproteobacteria bacterium]
MPTPARVAVVPEETGPIRIEEVSLPDPAPEQVVVKLFSSGVCHSQLHEMHGPRTGDIVLGHEATGEVVAIGSAVDHVASGDRVLVTWIPRTIGPPPRVPGAAVLTQANGRMAASQGIFTWADHTIADELYVVKLPDGARTDVTCIIGCAVMTGSGAVLNTAGVRAGQSVAIFGAGGVGLCAIAAAKVVGANPIIAVDLDEAKLATARRHGATETVNASQVDAVERIRELTPVKGGVDMMGQPVAGVDFAFDCIGAAETARQILPAARNKVLGSDERSTAVMVGIPREALTVEALDLLAHEKHLTGSIGGTSKPERDVPLYLEWYARGDLDLDSMVTRRYSLDEINDAVIALEKGEIEGRAILEF